MITHSAALRHTKKAGILLLITGGDDAGKFKIQNPKLKIQSTKLKIQNTKYKVYDLFGILTRAIN
jgi:hypothetical protein